MSGYQAGQGLKLVAGIDSPQWVLTPPVGATNPSHGLRKVRLGDAQAFPEAKPAPGPGLQTSVYAWPSAPCVLGPKPPPAEDWVLPTAWQEGARLWQQARIRTLYKDKLVMTLGWECSGERKGAQFLSVQFC